ncbi:helix-turn-helix transcriptional regulator [Microbacterium sp. YJN-G]|uniref:helix-turn-helix transcriptional regulator n=1 Tax=Microbacterium sp. YJN-G TaxID=2763257 RepID=UPI001D0C70AB|nr:helix-turn-helix domain-containing protein [Microbacterium sp. YJN-G]
MDTEHSPAGNPWGLEPLLDVGELAAYLGVPVSTVYDWRTRGLGPRAYRLREASEVRALGRADLDRAAARPRTASLSRGEVIRWAGNV